MADNTSFAHQRARTSLLKQRAEGLAQGEEQWLMQHLQGCADCSEQFQALEGALRALRMPPVMAGNLLVRSTQLKVRARARELTDNQSRMRPVWASCLMATLLAVFSTPYLWRGFEWLGAYTEMPQLYWETSFFFAWFLPAIIAIAVALWMDREDTADPAPLPPFGPDMERAQ